MASSAFPAPTDAAAQAVAVGRRLRVTDQVTEQLRRSHVDRLPAETARLLAEMPGKDRSRLARRAAVERPLKENAAEVVEDLQHVIDLLTPDDNSDSLPIHRFRDAVDQLDWIQFVGERLWDQFLPPDQSQRNQDDLSDAATWIKDFYHGNDYHPSVYWTDDRNLSNDTDAPYAVKHLLAGLTTSLTRLEAAEQLVVRHPALPGLDRPSTLAEFALLAGHLTDEVDEQLGEVAEPGLRARRNAEQAAATPVISNVGFVVMDLATLLPGVGPLSTVSEGTTDSQVANTGAYDVLARLAITETPVYFPTLLQDRELHQLFSANGLPWVPTFQTIPSGTKDSIDKAMQRFHSEWSPLGDALFVGNPRATGEAITGHVDHSNSRARGVVVGEVGDMGFDLPAGKPLLCVSRLEELRFEGGALDSRAGLAHNPTRAYSSNPFDVQFEPRSSGGLSL
jgi:hypothetical protein